jgi:hypothetical protein
MTAPQPPPLSVFICAQAVPRGYMPSQCFSPVAAIKTNHMVPMDGTAQRYSGSENLLWFGRLSNVTDRPMNGGYQIG